MWSGKKFIKTKQKSSTVLEKNWKRQKKFFYNLKKLKKKKVKEKKFFFVKFAPKRSTPKWSRNKMGNAKKGHNKTGRAKVVAPKRRASVAKHRKHGKMI